MNQILKNLVDVQTCRPFRGRIPLAEKGNAYALQTRDLSPAGEVVWDGFVRRKVDTTKSGQWLAPGDMVFIARGTRNYVVCLRDVPKRTVCSPNFFLLRIKSPPLPKGTLL